jgi:uncharacterized protein YyaL (SSP411 family)/aryl-alcohol dehydrogenase-like predicted oxidoreductase
MSVEGSARHVNRLIHSTSPYLLQHAHNPVDWYPWGEEALQRAREEDKPILLSIGYSACHWCHVMERESFEDPTIAALMNENFVCIKVDREERPDLDEIYMAATQAMNHGQGGWPMTVFLTPEREPFFAGTYFPPADRYGRPGFPTVLTRLAELWRGQRDRLREQGREMAEHLLRGAGTAPGGSLGEDELRAALAQYERDFDEQHGGFGGAPKFPPAVPLMLLLRLHRRFAEGGALDMARKTLDEMARGGMYDQLGGGFHRYSVDAHWLVPHFEKMLYDNALLARAYLEAHQATGDPFYARIATEVLDYVRREMTSPEGGFFSATDADSEGEEGRFFVWTPAQVEEALGDPEAARRVCAYYEITERGNWEGRSIPNVSRTGARVAASLGVSAAELEAEVSAARPRLYEARRRRVPPALDDKVLTSWNALMIGAFAEAYRVLGRPADLEAARRAARFVLDQLRTPQGRLLRTWRNGRAHLNAYLEDHAHLAEALIDLYEAGGDAGFLREAERLASAIMRLFAAPEGGFFSTASDHEALIVRHREGNDGAIPSANAAAAMALARLSYHLDQPALREEAQRALRVWGRAIARHPRAFAKSLMVLDLLLEGPVELAFVGAEGGEMDALRRQAAAHYLPNRIVGHHDPAQGNATLPLLAGKDTVAGRAALYVCRDFACQRPVTTAGDVAAVLESPRGHGADRLAAPRLPGSATTEGTAAYLAAQPGARQAHGYRTLGRTGLTVSAVGFGGYRVDEDTPEHRQALTRALRGGCNLVDTSTNYSDGGSERLVGQVLASLTAPPGRGGVLRREQVVVVSKIGYLQGRNLELAAERERDGRPFPGVVKYGEGIWHCIHPEFLADQLTRSLDRLGLETLDVCLLHNPEYFLKDAHERSHGKLEARRQEFHRRLAEAFSYLEAEVQGGRLRWYGVSSNTVAAPAADPEATSLSMMLDAAREGGGEAHHFAVLQLPFNLFEAGAARERNTGSGAARTVLEEAAAHGVAVLANRPLNAIVDDGMRRLADVEVPEGPAVDAQARVVGTLETDFRTRIASRLRAAEGGVPPEQLFRWAEELPAGLPHVRSLDHWEHIEAQRIVPQLVQVLQALDRGIGGSMAQAWHEWRDEYLPALQQLLAACRRVAAQRSRDDARAVAQGLDALLPPERRGEPLSRKAIWVLASTPGVTSVLVGMRRPAYVGDVLPVLEWPPLADPERVFEALVAAKG